MLDITTPPPAFDDREKAHYVGAHIAPHRPSGFKNPWPSFDSSHGGPLAALKCRFARDRSFVPVPTDRSELVGVRKPDFTPPVSGFKATWLGHAGFLIQCAEAKGASRGINILCDPVFSERTSPVQFFGPKRYTPPPCTLDELSDAAPVDLVLISHNHYDHADAATLLHFYHRRGKEITFVAALGNSRWLTGLGIPSEQVHELDWWDNINLALAETEPTPGASLRITCTPTQHFSARGAFDRNQDLWCSYSLEDLSAARKKVFFAGDTAYRSVPHNDLSEEEESKYPHCPAFAQIGELLGPFDLALLPIGLCEPRGFMSPVHCNQRDSILLHKDIRSKRSVGMHWGTVRGGLSGQYEDVRTPPKKWREVALEKGYRWREMGNGSEAEEMKESQPWEIGIMDVGESLLV